MTRNPFKAFLITAALAGTLGLASKAKADSYTGYLCNVQVAGTSAVVTVYSQSGCTGSYLGWGYLWAPAQPFGWVVNYWPTQSRYDLTVEDLLNNRWSRMIVQVDTGPGRNTAISSISFPQY